jgi:hypothetical protein
MRLNAFVGKKDRPSEKELDAALGPAKPLWDRLVAELAAELDVPDQEWKSYSPKAGWSLRLIRQKRVIVYLSPSSGSFIASFALGDRAVKAALGSGLPAPIVKTIKDAKRYAEGTGVRFEVEKPGDVDIIKKLAAFKMKS